MNETLGDIIKSRVTEKLVKANKAVAECLDYPMDYIDDIDKAIAELIEAKSYIIALERADK